MVEAATEAAMKASPYVYHIEMHVAFNHILVFCVICTGKRGALRIVHSPLHHCLYLMCSGGRRAEFA